MVNDHGRKLLEVCKNLSVLILNGRCSKDRIVGLATGKNSSVVDYCIAFPVLFRYIANFEVQSFNELYSDVHNGVSVTFNCSDVSRDIFQAVNGDNISVKLMHIAE